MFHYSKQTAWTSFRLRSSNCRHKSSCPFHVLGLRPLVREGRYEPSKADVSYEEVRVAFRKLAMLHHPDTAASRTNNKDLEAAAPGPGRCSNSTHHFTRIREAFESIVEGPDGRAVLREESLSDTSGNGINDQNREEYQRDDDRSVLDEPNGYLHKSVNPGILREVAEVSATMSPGGLDKGGMWQYADFIRKMAEKDDLPPLRVTGEANNDENKRRLSSRRRKRR